MIDFLGSGVLSILAFVVVISFVVVIHELGHYAAGRYFGVHAEAFSIGFGPTLVAVRDKRGTVWRVAALPLGGYVQFRGDRNAAGAPDRETLEQLRRSTPESDTILHFKPVWQRAIIVGAGPIANFALAIVLFAALGLARGDYVMQPVVGEVVAQSAAAQAGFEVGDELIAMDATPAEDIFDVLSYVRIRAGQPIDFTVNRGEESLILTATPRREMIADPFGGERALGRLGVGFSNTGEVRQVCCNLLQAPVYGVDQTAETMSTIVGFIGRLITGRASLELLNGPVGIATITGQMANAAVEAPASEIGSDASVTALGERLWRLTLAVLTLSALLSVTLGLMNLLPIPLLDGGHLVYYAYETVAQRPPSPAVQEAGFKVGLVLLVGMMVLATWNDLSYLRGLFS